MKSRAAVALEAGKPLEIVEVDLEGPKEGEVLVEIKATGICHTDEFTLSGADPEGIFPAILGHEGAGVVVDVGPGVKSPEEGRPRHSALHAGMPRVRVLPQPEDQPLPGDPLDPGPGLMPDGTSRFSLDGKPLHHYMGTARPSPISPSAGDRAGQDQSGRAVRQGLLHRLRRDHRHRRGDQHRQGRARLPGGRVRPRRHRPQRDPGRCAGRRRHDRRRRSQPTRRNGASASA
jgi:hypothetical protein